jgi:diphthine-ammonia ligase
MCGIIGIFNHEQAKEQVKQALAILKNRGKDGSKVIETQNGAIGHTLHAVVNHIQQPIQEKGILTSNCEIYNWEELNNKYSLNAKNDAELLLRFLDNNLDLEELDGVYAFAYIRDKKVTICRDIVGVKPLWFSHTTDFFSFASEKKALEELGHIDIQELNPRQMITYNFENKRLETEQRIFFKFEPEHYDKEKTKQLLNQAIKKRIPNKKFGLLFSGGIDSTFLAKYFKDNYHDFTCYTAVLDTENKEPPDLTYAKKIAKEFNLNLKIKKVTTEKIPSYLKKIVPLIESSNVIKVGVALPFYLASEMAKEDGCKVIFSGLGSEEIFAGYERHKNSQNINKECVSGLLKMYERDLYRDDVITMENNVELRLPFLDKELIKHALKIPSKYKINENTTKLILREIALEKGIPEEFAFRKKTAAQYGSKFDHALGKLAKPDTKSNYLKQFYPTHNLKLGVLFSSGKDSTSAALIMKKQNYQLTCLINLKSKNSNSYMFQSAGNELVELQAEAMGIPILIQETDGEKEHELKDLKLAIKEAKEIYKLDGIITGALFSNYQRDRIEKICDKLGLKIFSPLWHKPQEVHMREVIDNSFEVILVGIAADGFNESWLGRRIDEKMLEELKKKPIVNIGFEGGEAESLVLNCPLFNKKINIIKSRKEMDSQHSGKMIIEEAELI